MIIEPFITTVSTGIEVSALLKKTINFISSKLSDNYLNYDPSFLLNEYKSETPTYEGIPYSELVDLFSTKPSIEIKIKKKEFSPKDIDPQWYTVSTAGYNSLLQTNRIDPNPEDNIRLTKVIINENRINLTLQKATYQDQCRSNLILDFKHQNEPTLRQLLPKENSNKLPKIKKSSALANTIGVAALLFYKEKGEFIPYMVKREENVGVFPSGLHCTASGAVQWNDSEKITFDELFTNHMYQEIREEVGIEKNEIDEIVPMAICREFCRAGKPQIFYAGITSLCKEELIRKLKTKCHYSKKVGIRTEIKIPIFNTMPISKMENFLHLITEHKITVEGCAALYYGEKYINTKDVS